MNGEMLRILKMVEDGKLAPEEATKLIEALQSNDSVSSERGRGQAESEFKKAHLNEGFDKESFMKNDVKAAPGERFLQVRVLSGSGDKVKINLPLNFVRGILKATGKIPMPQVEQLQGINITELMATITAAIEGDLTGRIVDIETAEGDFVVVEIV